MLKKIITLAALLAPASAFANADQNRHFCLWIQDPNTCVNNSACFWDADDQRCEARGQEDLCSLAATPQVCQLAGFFCFWDDADNRCEIRGF